MIRLLNVPVLTPSALQTRYLSRYSFGMNPFHSVETTNYRTGAWPDCF